MKALITGGAGFIGSHLADEILRRGHSVSVIDDLSTGSRENVAHLITDSRFDLVVASILQADLVDTLVEEADCVFHLASAVGVKTIMDHPLRSITTNFIGTNNVLSSAGRYGRRVVFTSSSEIYGKSLDLPYREDACPLLGPTNRGRWSYACTKANCEFLAMAYHKEMDLSVVIVRLFNVIGVRQAARYGMVVPRFVKQALSNEPITIYGDGDQTRCFINVKDAVDAILRLFDSTAVRGDVFNIGTQETVTISELARLVRRVSESSSELKYIPYGEVFGRDFEDILYRTADIRKIAEAVGFTPGHTLEQSLKEVVDYECGLSI
jgi:UDP-glucose 4-epimerase